MMCVLGEEDFAPVSAQCGSSLQAVPAGSDLCSVRAGIQGLQGLSEFSRLTFPNAVTLSKLLTCGVVAPLSIR